MPPPMLLECSTDLTFRWSGRGLERTVKVYFLAARAGRTFHGLCESGSILARPLCRGPEWRVTSSG